MATLCGRKRKVLIYFQALKQPLHQTGRSSPCDNMFELVQDRGDSCQVFWLWREHRRVRLHFHPIPGPVHPAVQPIVALFHLPPTPICLLLASGATAPSGHLCGAGPCLTAGPCTLATSTRAPYSTFCDTHSQ